MVLRVDAAPAVGFGHVRRALALAAALAPWADCRFLVDAAGPALDLVRARGFAVERIPGDVGALLAATEALRADTVVLDSYTIAVGALRPLRDRVRLLVVIDDVGDFPLPAHLVVNAAPNVRPPVTRAEDYLVGPRFALLGPEFAPAPARRWGGAPERVLVSLGAAAPAGLLAALVGAARSGLPQALLDVVVGPASDLLLVRRALRNIEDVALHVAPSDMRALMLEADLAVSAGGVTLFELAATAVPTVGVALAANQRPNLIGLADARALLFAGGSEDRRLPAAVQRAVRDLDPHRRRTLGERARLLVDGQGARRVAEAMRARLSAGAERAGARA